MCERCKNIRVHFIIYFDDAVESFQNDQSCLICVYYIRTKQLWINNEPKKRTKMNQKSFPIFLKQTFAKGMFF